MSYDIEIAVKIEGYDGYARIASPEYYSPTYNLGKMFRAATRWDFDQGEYYKCEEVIGLICNGVAELRTHPEKYKQYEPENGWGTIASAVETLESLRECIYENAEYIPIEHLYVKW